MTGYGKNEFVTEKKEINVEMKSVNNRYLDVNVKLPRYLMFAEEKIKKLVSEYVTRAKIDMFINIVTAEDSGKVVKIDDQKEIYIVDETIKEIIISIDSGRNLQDRLDAISSPTRR